MRKQKKSGAIAYKIRMVYDFCDRAENGWYNPFLLSDITDTIEWLYRFKHISREEMSGMADRVVNIMKNKLV